MKFVNVKKMILAASLSLGFSVAAFAQGPYVKLGAGYQFGMGGEDVTLFNRGQYERATIHYGKGVVGNAALGYMFNPNVGAELGFSYLAGAENNTQNLYTNRVENDTYYSRMLLLMPSIVISAGQEGLNPYAKFGLVAAKGKVIHKWEDTQIGVVDAEEHLTGGWGLGLQAALGLEFGLSEQLGFFTEVSMSNLTYAPEKGETVAYKYNEVDQLHLLTTRSRETTFVENYPDTKPNEAAPKNELKTNLPFSSVGVNLGVKFNF